MKKVMFFVLALLSGAALAAQNKAVAITEVVDKEDKVPYAVEVMVRTKLTSAISRKQGYTAYDRVDLQSIMAEQNFQRTGLVDDSTIKKLGEMTGASLVLIPEVAYSDDGKIYVAVKMLDVTTAQTMMTTGQLMGSASEDVEDGCRILAAKVLGEQTVESNSSASADEPVTLFGYLHVFPIDIGEFQALPEQLLSAINKSMQYGYDSWRLPTTEELSIMRVNANLIPNFKNADYLCSDSSNRGYARLVTTEKKSAVERRREAIFNLLGVTEDSNQYVITDDYVLYLDMTRDSDFSIRRAAYGDYVHFYIVKDISMVCKYVSALDLFNNKYYKSINSNILAGFWGEDFNDRTATPERCLTITGVEFIRGVSTAQYMRLFRTQTPQEAAIQQEMQRLSQQP